MSAVKLLVGNAVWHTDMPWRGRQGNGLGGDYSVTLSALVCPFILLLPFSLYITIFEAFILALPLFFTVFILRMDCNNSFSTLVYLLLFASYSFYVLFILPLLFYFFFITPSLIFHIIHIPIFYVSNSPMSASDLSVFILHHIFDLLQLWTFFFTAFHIL